MVHSMKIRQVDCQGGDQRKGHLVQKAAGTKRRQTASKLSDRIKSWDSAAQKRGQNGLFRQSGKAATAGGDASNTVTAVLRGGMTLGET